MLQDTLIFSKPKAKADCHNQILFVLKKDLMRIKFQLILLFFEINCFSVNLTLK